MFSKIKVRKMDNMLKLDFGADDFQSVDLSGNNSGFSKVKVVNDNRGSSPPSLFQSSKPNLDTISNKDSDIGLQLLMNKDIGGRKSPSSPNNMSPSSLNLGSNSPSNMNGNNSANSSNNNSNNFFSKSKPLFMGGNQGINFDEAPTKKVDFSPGKFDNDLDLDMNMNDNVLKPNFDILDDNSQSNTSGNDLFSSFKPATTFDSGSATTVDAPAQMTFEQEQKAKADMLRKLERLRKKGYFIFRNFDMNSSLEDIKTEYENVKEEASLQRSLRQQKDILITTSRVIEGAAGTELVQEYTGKLELEGWSQHMMETVDDYEDIMEDLHDKYGKMFNDGAYPEARLLFAVIHSAVMFHITKKYVQQMPNLGNLLNSNPHLAREFSKATANMVGQQSPAFANMMNDMNMANGEPPVNMNSEPRDMAGPRDLENILNRLNTNNMGEPDISGLGMGY